MLIGARNPTMCPIYVRRASAGDCCVPRFPATAAPDLAGKLIYTRVYEHMLTDVIGTAPRNPSPDETCACTKATTTGAIAATLPAAAEAPTPGTASTPPVVHADATYDIEAQLGVPYALGVLCDPQPCKSSRTDEPGVGAGVSDSYDCDVCQEAEPAGTTPIPPSTGCKAPRILNLTLDLYTPVGVPAALGPRPAFVATHEGGYSKGTEQGCLLSALPKDPARPADGPAGGHMGEMTAACRHFAARGFVCITMTYRLTSAQTGGALAPANWTGTSPLNRSWLGGFKPAPQAIYPAVRDSKAAIRWLRGHAAGLNIDKGYVGAGGWSAGACTTVFLASQREADFTHEMNDKTDPTFGSLVYGNFRPRILTTIACSLCPGFRPVVCGAYPSLVACHLPTGAF